MATVGCSPHIDFLQISAVSAAAPWKRRTGEPLDLLKDVPLEYLLNADVQGCLYILLSMGSSLPHCFSLSFLPATVRPANYYYYFFIIIIIIIIIMIVIIIIVIIVIIFYYYCYYYYYLHIKEHLVES